MMTGNWWIVTVLGFLWIAGVTALLLHIRERIRKAHARRWISNGLGMTVSAVEKPTSFRMIIIGWHVMSVIGVFFVVAGVVGMVVRFAQAL